MIAFQFVQADDLGSRAIQYYSRGWPSHVDCVFPDGTLLGARSDAVGGKPPGVQIRPPGYAIWSKVQRVTLQATAEEETLWTAFLLSQVGKPYDMTAIAAFAVERDWRDQDSWFCSELGAASLENCHWLPKPLANPANEVTPRDLLLLLSPWAA